MEEPIVFRPGEGERVGTNVVKAARPELSLIEFEVQPGGEVQPIFIGGTATRSMPCLKRSGRVIAGFIQGSMVFKLTDPEAHARALSLPGTHLFDPSGRGEHFRQRIVVPAGLADEWDALTYTAFTQDHGPTCS